ncbi:MAG: hypothetical protein ACKOB1_06025, partial [Planctomycetia bacterium]
MAAPDAMLRLLDDPQTAAAWGRAAGLDDPAAAQRAFTAIAALGIPFDLVAEIGEQLHGVGDAVGHDARERPGAGRRDVDVDEPAYQPQRSVEHHDPVAHRAAAE